MLRKLRFFIRKYLGFSRTEANGFIILIPLMVILVLSPSILKQVLLQTDRPDNQRDIELLQEWISEIEGNIKTEELAQKKPETFDFDPNTSSPSELEQLGFSNTTAQRISKYRAAGGRFFKREELLKIYGISEPRVRVLWEHIKIRKISKVYAKKKAGKKVYTPSSKKTKLVVKRPLNPAPADSIMKIRGIGPVLSKRIVKYRERLGGFIHKNQLTEVYGLKADIQNKLWQQFELDSLNIRSININTIPDSVLWKHPYLSYAQAKAIVAYRDQHGPFSKPEGIQKIKIVNDSTLSKISPYLQVN